MPRLLYPPEMPEGVRAIVDILGNHARDQIVRALARNGPLTVGELVALVGAARPSVSLHLLKLEQAGVVHADVPPEERRGRKVRWAVDTERVQALARELAAYLLGDD